jgi:hypothetical protein
MSPENSVATAILLAVIPELIMIVVGLFYESSCPSPLHRKVLPKVVALISL